MERKNTTHPSNRGGLLLRSVTTRSPASSNFVLQWGNRKRLRCMKVQVKDPNNNGSSVNGAAARIVRSDLNSITNSNANGGYGHSNLRQRPDSSSHRILRNPDSSIGMRNQTDAGNVTNSSSHKPRHSGGGCVSGLSEGLNEGKKSGSSSGGNALPPHMWFPKFVIALTNKEKEEDFMAIKGSKLPQRPKKRAKLIQRTLNAVSPGAWLCDLTLERYEVREKKVSKKRARGLKALSNVDSDCE